MMHWPDFNLQATKVKTATGSGGVQIPGGVCGETQPTFRTQGL